MLKTGSYSLTLCSFRGSLKWMDLYLNAGFIVCDTPIVITYKDVPCRQVRHTPRSHTSYLIVAKKPGPHPEGFLPDFSSVYKYISPESKGALNSILNVPMTPNKFLRPGTKSPFRNDEKHPDLMRDLVDIYTAKGGTVVDLYAGAMPLGKACMRHGRKCILIESDPQCFDAAVARLEQVAGDIKASMQQAEMRGRVRMHADTDFEPARRKGKSVCRLESARSVQKDDTDEGGGEGEAIMNFTMDTEDEIERVGQVSIQSNTDINDAESSQQDEKSSMDDSQDCVRPLLSGSVTEEGHKQKVTEIVRDMLSEADVMEEEQSRSLAELLGENDESMSKIRDDDLQSIPETLSLKSVPSKCSSAHISAFRRGCAVRLFVGDKRVGTAHLRLPHQMSEEETRFLDEDEIALRKVFCRVLTLHDLRKEERNNETFVVIEFLSIDYQSADVYLPYATPGMESGTETLGDMNPRAYYIWDLKAMEACS